MEIIRIFGDNLFSFQLDGEKQNELAGLLSKWNDTSYLYYFVTENLADIPEGMSVTDCVNMLQNNAADLDHCLHTTAHSPRGDWNKFFKPLRNTEYGLESLSRQKGRNNYLRIYAIRIDANCFVITGGAIKFHHLNMERKHTVLEMKKLEKCRDFLQSHGIWDVNSFFELINDAL
ncbi:MAG: hypothetical protein ACOVOY_10025 [Sediminibacterium sp.]|jgi:hypothetical protein|nr:hypothetical protein [Chitinophagaceae bacterium]